MVRVRRTRAKLWIYSCATYFSRCATRYARRELNTNKNLVCDTYLHTEISTHTTTKKNSKHHHDAVVVCSRECFAYIYIYICVVVCAKERKHICVFVWMYAESYAIHALCNCSRCDSRESRDIRGFAFIARALSVSADAHTYIKYTREQHKLSLLTQGRKGVWVCVSARRVETAGSRVRASEHIYLYAALCRQPP